jgi:hypothetical protein
MGSKKLEFFCVHQWGDNWICETCGKALSPVLVNKIISLNNRIPMLGDRK